MDAHALGNYRILDLTGPIGFFAGKILADLGADVIKIEPPNGDLGRQKGPFWGDRPKPETSLYWMAYNANKRGITLNLDHVSGQKIFCRLAQTADFVLESSQAEYKTVRGLDPQRLLAMNPRLIWLCMSPYGRTGPKADVPADDLEILADSGFLSLLGDRRRPPVRVAEPQSYLWTGMTGAMAAMVALQARARTGLGQYIDVSAQASMMWALSQAPLFWDLNRETASRDGIYLTGRNLHGAAIRAIYPCADGYINFALYGGVAGKQSNYGLVRWMRGRHSDRMACEMVDSIDWDTWDVVTAFPSEIAALEGVLRDFFLSVTKREFMEAALSYRILGYPVADVSEILNDPHLKAVDFWRSVSIRGLGEVTLPGPFARFSMAEPVPMRPAPQIGEHNLEVYREIGLDVDDINSLRQAGVV